MMLWSRLEYVDCLGLKMYSGGSYGKESACNAGDPGFYPWVGKIPWRREWQSTPVLLSGEFHGHRFIHVLYGQT